MEYFSLSTGFYQKFRLQTQILLFESLFLKNDYIKQLQLKNMNFQFELQLRRKFKICQSNNSNLFAFSQKKVKCTCFLLFQKIVLEKVFKIYCGIPVCLLVPMVSFWYSFPFSSLLWPLLLLAQTIAIHPQLFFLPCKVSLFKLSCSLLPDYYW